MLQREKGEQVVKLFGFLGAVELAEGGPSTEEICNKLVDAVRYMEGVGQADFELLGEVTPESDEVGITVEN